mgnify:CR=1 FL=1
MIHLRERRDGRWAVSNRSDVKGVFDTEAEARPLYDKLTRERRERQQRHANLVDCANHDCHAKVSRHITAEGGTTCSGCQSKAQWAVEECERKAYAHQRDERALRKVVDAVGVALDRRDEAFAEALMNFAKLIREQARGE